MTPFDDALIFFDNCLVICRLRTNKIFSKCCECRKRRLEKPPPSCSRTIRGLPRANAWRVPQIGQKHVTFFGSKPVCDTRAANTNEIASLPVELRHSNSEKTCPTDNRRMCEDDWAAV